MYKTYTKNVCTPPGCIKKFLLVMKITAFFLFAALMQVSAAGLAQKLTFIKKDATLRQVFLEINKQTNYNIIWSDEEVNGNLKVDANFKNAPLFEVLTECLNHTPYTFTARQQTVAIKIKEASLLKPVTGSKAILTGIVLDSLGKPLPNATIKLQSQTSYQDGPGKSASKDIRQGKDLDYNTLTDSKGEFSVATMLADEYTLYVSYIGYKTFKKEITIAADKPLFVRVVLKNTQSQLDQVQVIAYGTQSKRFDIGAVSTVSAKDIERQPVTNVLLALEGLVPGLAVTPTSGAPGAAVQLQIRGQNTLLSSSSASTNPYDQPLFIIDGVPVATQNQNINILNSLGGLSTYGSTAILTGNNNYTGLSGLNSLNPQDIESISVLKDADATSIYGSQGANGVIIITTKKGKPGKTTFSFDGSTGINFNTRQVKLLNTPQYLDYRKEAYKNDGVDFADPDNPAADLVVFDQKKYTDWFKVFEGGHSVTNNVHASISGGTNTSNYIFSTGYTNAKFNFPGDFGDKRITMHSAYHQASADSKFNLDFSTDYTFDHNNSSGEPGLTQGKLLPPNAPDQLDASGNPVWTYKGADVSDLQQFAYLKEPSSLQSYSLNNSLRLSYQLPYDINMALNVGYSRLTTNESVQYTNASQQPEYAEAYADFGNTGFQTVNIEPQLNYKHTFGKGEFSALLGGSFKYVKNTSTYTTGYGYPADAFLNSLIGASTVEVLSDINNPYKYVAGFARLGYIYNRELILNITGRRDGSSNFGPGRQFGNFGSAGIGWIFTENSLIKTSLPFLSFGKLSANYGTSGSDGGQAYQYQAFYKVVQNNLSPSSGITPLSPSNLFNPDYSWSTKKSFNATISLGFLADRILFTADYYQNRTGGQLIANTLPSQTGFPSVLANLNATVQDKGLEIQITSINIQSKDFKWNTTFNISGNRNKLLSFPGLAASPYASRYQIGKPVTNIFVFKYKDVNPETGLFEFYDSKGNVTYHPVYQADGGDQQPIIDLTPTFTGSLGNTLTYKKVSLYFNFQFVKQMGLNYLGALYGRGAALGNEMNVPVQVLNHWRNPGDVSSIQKLTSGNDYGENNATRTGSSFALSSGAYSDASYVRLKTLSVSYDLPVAFMSRIGFKSGKLFANGQNLLTFSPYKVGDPEVPGGIFNFPYQRTFVLGLNFNL